jgi:CBS domain containing-hemolysin-like protein
MVTEIISGIIPVILLLVVSAFFSAMETSFSSVNRIRLLSLADNGSKSAKRALKISEKFDKALTAILIANNIANIAATSIATVVLTKAFGSSGVGISTLIMTICVVIFCEIIPKTLAKANSEKFACVLSLPLSVVMVILTPFLLLMSKEKNDNIDVTEDELYYIIDETEKQEILEESEAKLVRSALSLDETTVKQILIPRVQVKAVPNTVSIDELKEVFITDMYSRVPVYEENIDNIIGVIIAKEFWKFYDSGERDISKLIRDVMRFSEFKKLNEVLKIMQTKHAHLAVIVDQYGGTFGIITLEDIIEELIGEVYDESD